MSRKTKTSGTCEMCGRVAKLKCTTFQYDIDCECCPGGKHRDTVWHCKNCTPIKPGTTRLWIVAPEAVKS